ncbi:RNA polymerase sigma factor RpoE [soil metagenome]
MEQSLIERAREGDREAFSVLALQVSDGLFAVAQRVLRDVDGAADALQVALVRIWRDLPSLEDPSRFEAWAYRVLMRSCHDAMRTRRRHQANLRLLPRDGATVDDPAADLDSRDALERGFRTLTAEQRTILVLQYYRGLSLSEMADQLQIPIGTVRSRLHYAKRALRAAVEADARLPAMERKAR